MTYQVLARKWRPKLFEDVVGQGAIVRSLRNTILQKKIGHAYLLTGTRGVGKTTIARIFSKALRCLTPVENGNPCLICTECKAIDNGTSIDFTEIDGASNNGVENIRSIVENVQYLPAKGQYKIYVIDEVHMLSTSAFNALLKTLEEPPAHVIFLLATTDPEKLLGTVLSRCIRFDFKSVSIDDLSAHISHVAKAENIIFEGPDLIRKLAFSARGSVRDALSLFEQVLSFCPDKVVSEDALSASLGLANTDAIRRLLKSIFEGDGKNCSKIYRQLINDNIELKVFNHQLLDYLFSFIHSIQTGERSFDFSLIKIEDFSFAELFWIYQTLAKDLEWSINSLLPENNTELVLLKVSSRRQILSSQVIDFRDKGDTDPIKQEVKKEKTWDEFLTFLNQESPLLTSNLEHGNLIIPLKINKEQLIVRIGIPENGKVFFDYLRDKEVFQRLQLYLSRFFEVKLEDVSLDVELLNEKERQEKSFYTKVELDKKKEEEISLIKKNNLLSDPFIKEAEKLFNTKVDRFQIK